MNGQAPWRLVLPMHLPAQQVHVCAWRTHSPLSPAALPDAWQSLEGRSVLLPGGCRT